MPTPRPDPVLVNARREAVAVMLLWAAATAWSVGYCWLFGYGRSIESLTFVWGVPDWIFYGVFAPWGVCTAISIVYCSFFVVDEDWGPECDSQEFVEAPVEAPARSENAGHE